MRLSPRFFLWMPIGAVLLAIGSLATFTYVESRQTEPRFTVSAETTVLTQPLTRDGFVDYAAAARLRIQEIPPEENAARLLLEALGPNGLRDSEQWEAACEQLELPPLPRDGDYVIAVREWCEPIADANGVDVYKVSSVLHDEIDLCTEVPWRTDEHPQVAAWLSANEIHLPKIVTASKLSGFREPIHTNDWFYGSMMDELRVFGQLLSLRAMQRLEQGDLAGAWDDVLATFRLGRLTSQSDSHYFMAGGLESWATDATAAILSSPLMTPEWQYRIERDWNSLPPWRDYADYVDTSQRLQAMACIQEVSRMSADEFALGFDVRWTAIPQDPRILQFYLLRVNWDDVMIDVNGRIDDLRDVVSQPDLTKRAQQREWYDRDDRELMDFYRTSRLAVEDSIHALVVRGTTCVESYGAETTPRNIEARSRSMRIAFAVERYRIDHGSLPRTLYELVPAYLAEVPIDPYAPTQRVQFCPTTGDGYIIHNAGWRTLDGVEPLPEENQYSIRVRMPIAPWLLPDEAS